MGSKVEWSRSALADAQAAIAYIQNDSKVYAEAFKRRARELAETIAIFPGRGRVVPELGRSDVSEVFLGDYRLIYQVLKNRIAVAAFIHGARQLSPKHLNKRLT